MKVLGIDPGFTGAAVVFGHDGGVSNWPRVLAHHEFRTVGEDGAKRIDIKTFHGWLLSQGELHRAYVENAMLMPDLAGRKMGGGTGGRYMRCAGHIEATVVCAGIEIIMVMPAQWKRRLGLIGPKKGNSLDLARALCPDFADRLKRKKDHNLAEAALIAVYGASRADMIDLHPSGG